MAAFAPIFFTVFSLFTLLEGLKILSNVNSHCNISTDVTKEYESALHDFIIKSYRIATAKKNYHVMYAPCSLWMVMSAIAEGADSSTQKEMFKILNLPEDLCVRQKYYKLASTRIRPDVMSVINKRILFVDKGLKIDSNSSDYLTKNSLLEVVTLPMRINPLAALEQMRQAISVDLPQFDLVGNSVLVDVMDFGDIVATTFPDAVSERRPFYSMSGEQIGSDDFIKVRAKVKMGYVESIHSKLIAIPMGEDSRFQLMMTIPTAGFTDNRDDLQHSSGNLVDEAAKSLRETAEPIEIVFPKPMSSFDIDILEMFSELGMNSTWNTKKPMRSLLEPTSVISRAIHRAHLSMEAPKGKADSLKSAPSPNATIGVDPRAGSDFIADRPIIIGIYETETYTCMMGIAYSKPSDSTYRTLTSKLVELQNSRL